MLVGVVSGMGWAVVWVRLVMGGVCDVGWGQ